MTATCLHCRRRPADRARGLCNRCYYRVPGVRLRYPLLEPGPGGREAGGPTNCGGPPEAPTDAPPGTPAKMEALAERAARGLALFHPRDRKGED